VLAAWMLSKFYRVLESSQLQPVCTAYGSRWLCPRWPATDDGWALVHLLCGAHQLDAAKYDPRIVVCPAGSMPAPTEAITAYSSMGAIPGMSMDALLSKLSETEPLFAMGMSI